MWVIGFNELLTLIGTVEGCQPVTYVDDLLILVEARSGQDFENTIRRLFILVSSWLSDNNLKVSAAKSRCCKLKDNLNIQRRLPVLKLMGDRIPVVSTFKWLGVVFGAKMNAWPHVECLSAKIRA